MTRIVSIRPTLLALALGSAPSLAAHAQTFDSTAGTAPSQKLSTPPDAAPINQPGAMRRAYSHHAPAADARHRPAGAGTQPAPATPRR